MKNYAGIGSRTLNDEERHFCKEVAFWLARQGWTLYTGAAPGADQAFAEGALSGNGKVVLCLPWPSFEYKWRGSLGKKEVSTILVDPLRHPEAFASVGKFHPNPEVLKDSMRRLHARNFLIVQPTKFVLAWPRPGKFQGSLGGTGQGIRIAEDLGLTLFRMDNSVIRDHLRVTMNKNPQ